MTDPELLSWNRSDIEQRLLFSGGRFTNVNNTLSVLGAGLLTAVLYGGLTLLPANVVSAKLVGQGPIPYFIVFFSALCLSILGLKGMKLRLQKRCLKLHLHDDPTFVLSPTTVRSVRDRMHTLVDDPSRFVLFNRITIALSNLQNIGRVSDVDEILRSQADADELATENSYLLLRGLIWAIPMLGFIGTVLGLSIAIGEFGNVIAASGDTAQILPALQDVTGGLGIAFDTTLEALVAALTIQLLTTLLHRSEQTFLAQCSEYCTKHITNRLRLLAYAPAEDSEYAGT